MEEKFGLSSGPFGRRLRKLGRRVPAYVRKDMAQIERAEQMMVHPKLIRQYDSAALESAYRRSVAHLEGIDVKARRKATLLNLTADLMAKVLIVIVLVLLVLYWQGFIGG